MRGDPEPTVGWSVAAAAERVGVSVSTLHSWERRYGLEPQGRTVGGHRRYTAADVAMLQRLHRLATSGMTTSAAAAAVRSAAAAPHTSARRSAESDLDAVTRELRLATDQLDVAEAERIARHALSRHGAVRAWTEVFVPALQAAGDHWEHTHSGVECEHAGTAAVHTALLEYTRRQGKPNPHAAARTLLAATPSEEHTLPLDALAAALAEQRVPTSVLGTLPADALCAAVDRLRPAGLVLFARSRESADLALLRAVASTAPLVCAAGDWPRRLPTRVATATDLPEALAVVIGAVGLRR